MEGRLAKEKYLSLKPGSLICFNESLTVQVVALRRYETFQRMIDKEGVEKVLPGLTSKEAEAVYRRFYTTEEESLYGVLAIEVLVC